MSRNRLLLFFSLLFGVASVTHADPCGAVNFSCLQVGEQVLNYYDGGFGSLGSGPGPHDGITFSSDVVVVPQGVPFADVLQGAQVSSGGVMNLVYGFSGLFSFYYTDGSGEVELFSGSNGTGTQVGAITLAPETGFFPAGGAEPLFHSAVFQLSTPTVIIDNVSFGGLVVPEPAAPALLVVGIGALLLFSRRLRA